MLALITLLRELILSVIPMFGGDFRAMSLGMLSGRHGGVFRDVVSTNLGGLEDMGQEEAPTFHKRPITQQLRTNKIP